MKHREKSRLTVHGEKERRWREATKSEVYGWWRSIHLLRNGFKYYSLDTGGVVVVTSKVIDSVTGGVVIVVASDVMGGTEDVVLCTSDVVMGDEMGGSEVNVEVIGTSEVMTDEDTGASED
ncbi:hypothetical protein L2E82_45190 [Cichorium intybus]|uniref:Uncharacterized protein n=1 Tax=Cichorium intybus TaxID=13427 RepID=A0ACB8ZSM9_CICIN|nr:hypothetical protein L2E82_45190 [Cichorium intybus]